MPHAQIPGDQPLYQVPFARAVKQSNSLTQSIASMAVGQIQTPAAAQQIIEEGSADVVLLGRALSCQ